MMSPTSVASPNAAPTQPTNDEKREFVEDFGQGWAKGNRNAFLAHFTPRIHPDAHFHQPLSRGGYGHAGLRRMFTPLFAAVPDLHGTIHRWGPTDDGVLIEFTLRGTLGRRQISVDVVDRVVLRDGCIAGNHTYFDPIPLIPRMLAHPIRALRLLPRFVPSRGERAHTTERVHPWPHQSTPATPAP